MDMNFKGKTAIVTGMTLMNLVISLLTHKLILKPVKPSITDCPARVPVTEDEMPAESSARAKTTAAKFPNSGIRVL